MLSVHRGDLVLHNFIFQFALLSSTHRLNFCLNFSSNSKRSNMRLLFTILVIFLLSTAFSAHLAAPPASIRAKSSDSRPIQWHCNLKNLETCASCACYQAWKFKLFEPGVKSMCKAQFGQRLWSLRSKCHRYLAGHGEFKNNTLDDDMYITTSNCLLRPEGSAFVSTSSARSLYLPAGSTERFLPFLFGVAARVALIVARQAAAAAARAAATAAREAARRAAQAAARKAAEIAAKRKAVEAAARAAKEAFKRLLQNTRKKLDDVLKKAKEFGKNEVRSVAECMTIRGQAFDANIIDDKKLRDELSDCLEESKTICLAVLFHKARNEEVDGLTVVNGVSDCLSDRQGVCVDSAKSKFKGKAINKSSFSEELKRCVPGFTQCIESSISDLDENDINVDSVSDEIAFCIIEGAKNLGNRQ